MIVEMQGRDDADQAARRADLAALRNGPARQYSLRVFFAGEPGFFGAGDYKSYRHRLDAWRDLR